MAWASYLTYLVHPTGTLMGPGGALPMGVCLICLAWAALWLRSPYERVLNMFGMGRPMAAVSLWACA